MSQSVSGIGVRGRGVVAAAVIAASLTVLLGVLIALFLW